MEINPSYLRRVNPIIFAAALAFAAEVVVYQVWGKSQLLGLTSLATLFGSLGGMFALKAALLRLGKKGPGKKFVAEVLVIHWRGETTRIWAAYRYEWVANFAAQYLAYLLDHTGDVYHEFGIEFRVHDATKRRAAETNLDAETPQPA
jgi:hypothetical protein